MKQELAELVNQALKRLETKSILPIGVSKRTVHIERVKNKAHGDFASNIALTLSRQAAQSPQQLAQQIIEAMPDNSLIYKAEIAGPGFINFFIEQAQSYSIIKKILKQGDDYGKAKLGQGKLITVEFVSANPTGPLHIGHGRGAAFGDSLSRLLRFAGYQVFTEYYFNDAGRQMDILALSVWLRYIEQLGLPVEFPDNAYQGDYIKDTAASIAVKYATDFATIDKGFFITHLETDAEAHLDQLIENMRNVLGRKQYQQIFKLALDTQIEQIKQDLHEFRVDFNQWFTEKSLEESGAIEQAISKLRDSGYIYEKDGAQWFKASAFGDEKDRVVIRKNARHTYFAADLAYMVNKVERGFKHLIYVFGADHHGTVARMQAAFQALGYDLQQFTVLLVQMVSLYRGNQRVSMSTRRADYVTLKELREEVGLDATRFFYSMRKNEQQMDFDMDLAKSQSNENPVYYVQYAHARISSILRLLKDKNIDYGDLLKVDVSVLVEEPEKDLITQLQVFPELIESSAKDYAPHQITYYLRELATLLHSYYNQVRIQDAAADLLPARVALIMAVKQVLKNGLGIIAVTAPEQM